MRGRKSENCTKPGHQDLPRERHHFWSEWKWHTGNGHRVTISTLRECLPRGRSFEGQPQRTRVRECPGAVSVPDVAHFLRAAPPPNTKIVIWGPLDAAISVISAPFKCPLWWLPRSNYSIRRAVRSRRCVYLIIVIFFDTLSLVLTILLMLCYDDYRLLIGNFITVRFDNCKNCYVCCSPSIFCLRYHY